VHTWTCRKKKELAVRAHGHHQILGQHDSELLISYLTVPYLRLPLVLTFFASDDRLHKLQSRKLRAILDSVLFEPGRCAVARWLRQTDPRPDAARLARTGTWGWTWWAWPR
jgi:hypothetical protein